MKVLKYPVIVITLAFAIGIATDYYFNPEILVLCILATILFIAVLLAYKKSNSDFVQRPYFVVTAILFSFIAGMFTHSLHYAPNNPSHYSRVIQTNEAGLIKGIISERIKPNDYNEKYFFTIVSVNKQKTTGKVLLTVPKDSVHTILHAGDVIILYDKFFPVTSSLNPSQFDYAAYMKKHNVFHQLKLKDNYIEAGQEKSFGYYIEVFRNKLIHSFAIHEFSPQVLNVVKALLLGQRQDMDKEITTDYANAGVIHILAISGLHIGILFAFISIMLKPLERLKRGKLLKLILSLSFLWMFAILSGLSASVVRSVVMFSFIGIGLYVNRGKDIYNTIAASMLVLLLAKPNFLFDAGFQLSYTAVLGIVLLHPVFKKTFRSKYNAVNYITDLMTVSVAAQIGVLPLSLYYFNQFPVLFIFANIIVIPLSTIILVTGLVVLGLNFLLPKVAIYFGKILEVLILAMNGFIKWIASFDFFIIKDIPFTLLLTILLYTTLSCLLLWLYKKSYYRTVAMLSMVLVFQATYMATKTHYNNTTEMVICNNWENPLLIEKNKNQVTVYTNDTLPEENRNLKSYLRENFNPEVKIEPLKNTLWYNHNKVLVIDSLGIYGVSKNTDVLLLTHSPKINLEKALNQLKPKQVIADATNYKSYVARWAITCQKQKIPFHATAEKGFYKIE